MRQNVADKLQSRKWLHNRSKPSLRRDAEMTAVSIVASIFPYDSRVDSVMDHQHLVMAYCLTWIVQLCYLGYVGRKWYSARNKKDL
jgi:hypothetical protein